VSVLFAFAETLAGIKVTNGASAKQFRRAKEYQFRNIFKLRLITYPDCYDCFEDDVANELIISIPPIDIEAVTGTTPTVTNVYLEEKYTTARPLGTCDEYLISNSTGASVSVNYTDCDETTRTLTINDAQTNVKVCAKPGQSATFTGVGLTVTLTVDGCAGPSGFVQDVDLYFRPTGGGYAGYNITPPSSQSLADGAWLHQTFLLEINVYGNGPTYIPVGFGQRFNIVYDGPTSSWKIVDIYQSLAEEIATLYNLPFDQPAEGTCHPVQGLVKIDKLWLVDDEVTEDEFEFTEQESGCSKYDYIIEDELGRTGDMRLVGIAAPIYSRDSQIFTYKEVIDFYEATQPRGGSGPHVPLTGPMVGKPMWMQWDLEYNDKVLGLNEYEVQDCQPPFDYNNLLGVASIFPKRFVEGGNTFRNNVAHCVYNGRYFGEVKKRGPYYVDNSLTKDGTLTGYSEFRDGVYTIVPLAGKTGELLSSYRRRKLFGKLMCGGVTSYTFSNGWLNGALYFFQYMRRGSTKFCKECLYRKVESDGSVNYYYRSTPYNPSYSAFENQSNGLQVDDEGITYNQIYSNKTKGFYGTSRTLNLAAILNNPNTFKEYTSSLGVISGTNATKKEINFPTTIVDLGPRTTWIKEVCFDSELDVNCSITRSIGSTSYKGLDDLMEYIIQSKEIKERGRLDVQDLFDKRGGGLIDGDIAQLLNFNTQVGIYPLETEDDESPYFIDYTDTFDFKGPIGIDFLYSEDNPETVEVEANGYLVRSCLNKKGRLGDNSQRVPYFMWDTRGHGFGEDGPAGESQTFFTSLIYNQRYQQMKANTNLTIGDSLDDKFQDGYVLPPIRDCIDTGSGKLKINDNYKEYTVFGNTRHLMEIGGPYHYNFGLMKGLTAYDKFIENFGPK
jgi:hypothetical protein